MEILGIGPSELLFIVIIALIVLGPKDMQKTGRTIGKWLRRIVTSDGWKLFQQTSREIQTLPNRLMREAALDELKDVQKDLKQPLDVGRNIAPPAAGVSPAAGGPLDPAATPAAEPRILPSTPAGTSSSSNEDQHA